MSIDELIESQIKAIEAYTKTYSEALRQYRDEYRAGVAAMAESLRQHANQLEQELAGEKPTPPSAEETPLGD